MFVVLVNVIVPALWGEKVGVRHKQVVVILDSMVQVVAQSGSGQVVKDRIKEVHSIRVSRMVLETKKENQVV